LREKGGRVGFSSFIWVQWRGAKDTAALFGAEPLHLSLLLALSSSGSILLARIETLLRAFHW
jgi:hypothetical protein